MRVFFLLVRRVPAVMSPVLAETFKLLEARGFHVRTLIAEDALLAPDRLDLPGDVYVLKSHTELSLSLAGILHARGARILNPYPACATTQNKIVAHQRLRAAGVPVPDSWVTGDARFLEELVADRPLIVKPFRGHRGAGIHVVRNRADLAALELESEPMIVQEFVPGTGYDLKVYVVGEDVYAVKKPFSPDSFTKYGEPVRVTPEVRDIALRCGRAFGLGLYGVDMIEGPDGPVVVDLNYFPGYKGVPAPAPRIAWYIARFARGEIDLALPDLRSVGGAHPAPAPVRARALAPASSGLRRAS